MSSGTHRLTVLASLMKVYMAVALVVGVLLTAVLLKPNLPMRMRLCATCCGVGVAMLTCWRVAVICYALGKN